LTKRFALILSSLPRQKPLWLVLRLECDQRGYDVNEKDWLCIVKFLPTDNPEGGLFAADIIGYLVGYANLTNTRSLALLGDPDAGAYPFLFSFRLLRRKTSS
jgi:hypothetical protein